MKKFLIAISLFVISFFSFSGISFAAANKEQTTAEKVAQDIKAFQLLAQSLYTITWPLLWLGGKFMDNQVVYGHLFGMDVVLWKMWNVIRSFANYIIGFILLFSIFTLFLGGKWDKFNPLKLLPQLAVAAVLVNASWFLIGACIDVANVLTYSLGTMPLKIVEKKKLIKTDITIPKLALKMQDGKQAYSFGIYTENDGFLPFCQLSFTGQKVIVGQKTEISDYVSRKSGVSQYDTTYCVYNFGSKWIKLKNGSTYNEKDFLKGDVGQEIKGNVKIGELASKHGLTGLFGTLYASLIQVGSLSSFTNSGGLGSLTTELIMKFIFLIALLIPLIVLAIILLVRVVVIWLYIIFSPLIFLFTPLKDIGGKLLGEKGKLSQLCCMVFLPVFVVFALSMSVVFMAAVANSFSPDKNGKQENQLLKHLGIDTKCNKDDKKNCVTIDVAGKPVTIEVNMKGSDPSFATMFANLGNLILLAIRRIFGIAFMWILVFTALKSCKLTEKIAGSVQKFSQDMLKSAPILPGGQSVASLGQALSQVRQMPQRWQESQFDESIKPFLDELNNKITGTETEKIKKAVKNVTPVINQDTQKVEKALNVSNYQKETVNKAKGAATVTAVASKLGISDSELKDLLKKHNIEVKDSTTLTDLLNKINKAINDAKLKKEELEKLISQDKLKKYIKDNMLDKNITFKQVWEELSEQEQEKLKDVIKQVTGISFTSIADNDNLAKALCKLGFKKEEVMKLIADNLDGSHVPLDKQKELETIAKNAGC